MVEHVFWLQGAILCMGSSKGPSINSNCRIELQDLFEHGEADSWRSRMFSCTFFDLEWISSAKIHVMVQGHASIDSRSFQI